MQLSRMPLNPPRHICTVEGPRLGDRSLSLQACPAVTPPRESAAHTHPVLLSSLRPIWHHPASQCQAGEGRLGQWPGLSVFPLCAAVLPHRAAMEGRAGKPSRRPGLPCLHGVGQALLAGFHKQASKTSFPMDCMQEATHGPRPRALGHSELRPCPG